MDEAQTCLAWALVWMAVCFATVFFWDYAMMLIRRYRSRPIRIFLVSLFLALSYLDVWSFRNGMRAAPTAIFGFYYSVVIPALLYWLFLAPILIGAVILFYRLILKPAKTISHIQSYFPFHLCLAGMRFTIAAAFGSVIGFMLAVMGLAQGIYLFTIGPEQRRRIERNKWD
jgi:hypothetical protein